MFFFFFQAEDGIRDADVTGVQTCALPICLALAGLPRTSSNASSPAGTSACSPRTRGGARRGCPGSARRAAQPGRADPADPGRRQRPLLKAPLDRIEDHSIAVDTLSIHNPDLDDVFFALTGLGSAGHDPPGTG